MARGGSGPVGAEINPAEWKRFLRDLKRLEPEVRKTLIKEFKELLGPLQAAAKSNAGWSSRIPGAIAKSVTTKKVGLRVRGAKAPHGRPFEGITGATFRHPVFGNREVWVSQAARPFLKPAVDAHKDEFLEAAGEAVDEAARKTGWT